MIQLYFLSFLLWQVSISHVLRFKRGYGGSTYHPNYNTYNNEYFAPLNAQNYGWNYGNGNGNRGLTPGFSNYYQQYYQQTRYNLFDPGNYYRQPINYGMNKQLLQPRAFVNPRVSEPTLSANLGFAADLTPPSNPGKINNIMPTIPEIQGTQILIPNPASLLPETDKNDSPDLNPVSPRLPNKIDSCFAGEPCRVPQTTENEMIVTASTADLIESNIQRELTTPSLNSLTIITIPVDSTNIPLTTTVETSKTSQEFDLQNSSVNQKLETSWTDNQKSSIEAGLMINSNK